MASVSELVNGRCCGLDVHKQTVVACVRPGNNQSVGKRKSGRMTEGNKWLKHDKAFVDLGVDYFEKNNTKNLQQRLIDKPKRLGCKVTIENDAAGGIVFGTAGPLAGQSASTLTRFTERSENSHYRDFG